MELPPVRHSILVAVMALACAAALAADPGDALRRAAREGDLAQVRTLLDSGVPASAATPNGLTALHGAAEGGHGAIVRLLVERGADVNATERFFGSTPLGNALDGNNLEVVRLLLERGAAGAGDVLAYAAERGDTGLARAALATGRVEPLELAAARRAAPATVPEELTQLLASASVARPERAAYPVSAERLQRYAGRYRGADAEAVVAVREGGLVLTLGGSEIRLAPIAPDRFEDPSGGVEARFGGRGGLVERVQVNRSGEIVALGAVTADPQPMREAAAKDPGLAPAPRGPARPWPQFRGLDGSGNGDGQGAPGTWDVKAGTNVRFKTPVPGIALSSPIVNGGRIFLTAVTSAKGDKTFRTGLYGDGDAVDDVSEHSFRVLALDAQNGKLVWEHEAHRGAPGVRRHLKSSQANATPVTDGKRVVALFGSVGLLAAYDLAGTPLWRREVGVLDCSDPINGAAEWGHASSPILYGDLVIVQGDRRSDSFVAAYRLADGTEAWRVPREETSTWSTPVVLPGPAGDELVTNGKRIRGYDPRTGKLLWSLGPNSEVVVATPVVGAGLAFVTAGYPPVRPIYAIRPGHRGDLSLAEGKTASDAIAWSHPRGGTYLPTPILYRGYLYTLNNNGVLACYRAETGEQVYQTRVGGGGDSFSASPVAADGRLYFAAESGEVYVLRAGEQYELLATNAMDEVLMATPAIAEGLLVVRTLGHVVGIAEPPGGAPPASP